MLYHVNETLLSLWSRACVYTYILIYVCVSLYVYSLFLSIKMTSLLNHPPFYL